MLIHSPLLPDKCLKLPIFIDFYDFLLSDGCISNTIQLALAILFPQTKLSLFCNCTYSIFAHEKISPFYNSDFLQHVCFQSKQNGLL